MERLYVSSKNQHAYQVTLAAADLMVCGRIMNITGLPWVSVSTFEPPDSSCDLTTDSKISSTHLES
jgi:hypothetical protein